MVLPPAYQVETPYGVDIGGVSPALWDAVPTSQYDSWLTVGTTKGVTSGEITSVGIDFSSWGQTGGLVVDDGAVFWLDPAGGPTGTDIVVAQLTLVSGTDFSVTMNMRGRRAGAATVNGQGVSTGDWEELGVTVGMGYFKV